MPLNPFTGEFEGYDAPTTQAGVGMAAMATAGVEAPFAFRMLENMPGVTASMGFSSFRGTNTIMRGGYSKKNYLDKSPSNFVGRKARRQAAAAANKQPFVKRALQNNMPRPGNALRYSDLSIFGASSRRLYSPFSASSFLGRSKKIAGAVGVAPGEDAFGPGLTSFISAGTRADRLEARALKGSKRAMAKLNKLDQNIEFLAKMNNPAAMTARTRPLISSGGIGSIGMTEAAGVGARGNMLASSMAGVGTQKIAGYFRGAGGYGSNVGFQGLQGAARAGAELAEQQFTSAFTKAGLGTADDAVKAMARGQLGKKLGASGIAKIAQHGGAKFLAARGAALAIPGLQVVAAASFAYDVGKMAGEAVKGSINLARDSVKSLQGSIYKPMFGMGYNDTEAAATSRARGVMAIQNSRLNARSMLGSEASMLAAHFG